MEKVIDAHEAALLGRKALAENKLNLALNHLCNAVRIEPSAENWISISEVYAKLGRGNIRLAYLDAAISLMEQPSEKLLQLFADARAEFLKVNPNILEVQRLYVKNPDAPRIRDERKEFFKLINAGRSDLAFALGLKQYKRRRVDPLIQGIWGSLASRNGEPQMALNAIFASYLRSPKDWVTVNNIADTLVRMRSTLHGLDFALAAVNLNPKIAGAWINLAAAFENQGSHWEAVKACREAIKLNPKEGLAWTNLGNSLKNSGRASEATEAFREAVKLLPNNADLWSNYLFGILYDEGASEAEIAREAFRFGAYWEPKIKPKDHRARLKAGMPDKLRVGFVSADIRSHPVAYFCEPLFEHLDREKFEIFIYDNYLTEDIVTKRFKNFADKWLNIDAMKDSDVVKLVIKDKIDILVDMSGHTARNRLIAFAHKPAPVQVSWLGYPGTTGLKRMDWRFTDCLSDPVGSDEFHSEKLYRFNVPSSYAPLVKAPELRKDPKYHVNPTPALLNGYVTFGSCNNLAKINQKVIQCWSGILQVVPGSKILIESPGIEQVELRAKIISDFSRFGIAGDRVILHNRDHKLQYLRYHEIDVALDPFPYGGGTTSSDLLWMGVPLITLKSPTIMGRAGASLLTYLGRSEWVAESVDQYVSIAKNISENFSDLNVIRHSLRENVEKSPLMDGKKFAEDVGKAFIFIYNEALKDA